MKKDVLRGVKQYNASRKRRKNWQKVVMLMACVVVFCTTYALILPAITMEGQQCQIPEHTHTDECYTLKTTAARQVLHCSYESLGVHQHTEDCYDDDGNLICGQEDFVAHTHDETCYDANGALVCELPEIKPHTHDESCYTLPQPHVHDESCYERVRGELICTESTEAAEEATDVQICELPEDENHTHGEGCYEKAPAAQPHVHTDECYAWENVLVCDKSTEPDPNARPVLTCEEPEIIPHTHTEECYDKDGNLVCGEVELLVHQHTASCFETLEEPLDTTALACTLPENENHTHTERCYGRWELTCGLEEHTHSLACYADPQADVETAENWEATFASAMGSGDWRKDAAAIAKTQLGYTESKENYVVAEDGETVKGYTRYGAWFGQPYGDWNALFASFCLNYAGAEITGQTCQDLITALGEYYVNPAEHAPQPGEPVFLDMDGDGAADQVGILTEIAEEAAETGEGEAPAVKRTLTVIGGDLSGEMGDAVREERYSEASVVGYGAVPKAAQPFTLTAQTEGGITVTVSGEDSSLPYPVEEITLTAEEVVDEDSLAIRDELLEKNEEEAQWLFLLDITLWHGEEKIEPIGPVQVTFSGLETNGLYPEVYHIDTEKREAVDMSVTTDEDGNVMMDTDHFSLFAARARAFAEIKDEVNLVDGGNYKLVGDVETSTQVTITQDTSIDLNGYDLYYKGTGDFLTVTGGTLTILDSKAAQTSNGVKVPNSPGITAKLDYKNNNAPQTLTYYVTESNPIYVMEGDPAKTGTKETTKEYVVSITGSILTQGTCSSIVKVSGGTFNLQGGLLTNPKLRVVCVDTSNSTMNMTGGYIAGGTSSGIFSRGNVTISGGVIAANTSNSGGGICSEGGSIKIEQNGIISGNMCTGDDGRAGNDHYGGGIDARNTVVTISGGYITNNRREGMIELYPSEHDGYGCRGTGQHGGGGISARGGSLTMTGGYVTGNFSEEAGGGIYAGTYSWGTTFVMQGGTVAGNRSDKSEGGGIRIGGATTGTIEGSNIYITNNTTGTEHDWGGGGVFVQENGTLFVREALITKNTAEGFGGGVAACPTGRTVIVEQDGAAIYSNEAHNAGRDPGNIVLFNGKPPADADKNDDNLTLADSNPGACQVLKSQFLENGDFKDYYCVKANHYDPITLVMGQMLGGGDARWSAQLDSVRTNVNKPGYATANWLCGMTAKPTDDDKSSAISHAKVFITGNTSSVHGGGIMSNGNVVLGRVDEYSVVSPGLNITGQKRLEKDNESVAAGDLPPFTFLLLSKEPQKGLDGKWNLNGIDIVGRANSNTEGKFSLTAAAEYQTTGTHTYYLVEEIGDDPSVTYDDTVYKVTVDITSSTKNIASVNITTYSIASVKVENLTHPWTSSGPMKFRFDKQNNVANWGDNVYLYVWTDNGQNEILGNFPGTKMQHQGGTIYELEVAMPSGVSKVSYIISNGSEDKTVDRNCDYSPGGTRECVWNNGNDTTSDPHYTITGTSSAYTLALQGDTFTNHTTASVSLKIVKKDEEHPEKLLKDATFRLREEDVDDPSKDVSMTTGQNGEVTFTGLKKGTNYYLWEDTAPANYYKAGPWILKISGNGGGKLYTAKEENGTLEKTNEGTDLGSEGTGPIVLTANISDKPWGYELPATGGTGTGWYTLGGLLMTLLAAGLLVYNKKGRRGGVAFL